MLWDGNGHRARQQADAPYGDVEDLELDYPRVDQFARSVHDFSVDITSNAGGPIDDGERFRAGEHVPTAMAESTVDALVNERLDERQQMQRTRRGVHLLLRTHARALDGTARPLFEQWYPGLANDSTGGGGQAAEARTPYAPS